jgi:hypothetical protein
MFASVKNKEQRTALIGLLTFIVEGTKSHGFVYVPQKDGEKLLKAEPTFITLDPAEKNSEGQIKAVATQTGIDALAGHNSADAKATQESTKAVASEPLKFEFVSLESIPQINRGGVRTNNYPFDQLQPHPAQPHAFFVPATEARPNPAKSLASTVASATKRCKGKDNRVFTLRKGEQNGVSGAYVIRVK